MASHIQDPISRVPGVGDYQLFGTQYAMRVWLDPAKLNNFGLTPLDVSNAIKAQNVQVASGELGGLPAVPGQQINATILGPSYLQSPEQFGQILLRVEPSGAQVRLRDVARITFGSEKYSRRPGSTTAIRRPGSPSSSKAAPTLWIRSPRSKRRWRSCSRRFRRVCRWHYPLDAAPFVKQSITEVVKTLAQAIVLVFLVMLLFLQNIRATLIPTIAVPVVLLGTCAVLAAAGYSINSLTMFGMVLAIGLLVDDAIVVVENVERVMEEEHLSPQGSHAPFHGPDHRRSSGNCHGALGGVRADGVLQRIDGVIYRQFSITIVSSMILSVLVALIFTPALCATLLKRPEQRRSRKGGGLISLFNRGFERAQAHYGQSVVALARRSGRALIVLAVITVVLTVGYLRLPHGFLPDEDQGNMYVQIVAPPGATASHVVSVLDEVTHYLLTDEAQAIDGVLEVRGFSFGGKGQNAGLCFIRLKPWDQRRGARNRVQQIAARLTHHFASSQQALIIGFRLPRHWSSATRRDSISSSSISPGPVTPSSCRRAMRLVKAAGKDPILSGVRPNGLDDEPQYRISIDREKASALGLTISDINDTITAAWGSSYINDFLDRGRVKRVYIQGDPTARMLPQDLESWYARNTAGLMVPFSAFAHGSWAFGSPKLERYNGVPSIEILGAPAPGHATGEAMDAIEKLAAKLPNGVRYQWTGLSYEEKLAGSKAELLYGLSIAVVFLCLAALYESWSIPVAVLLVVPLGIVGAVLATWDAGLQTMCTFKSHADDDGVVSEECDSHRRVREGESRARSQSALTQRARRRASVCVRSS